MAHKPVLYIVIPCYNEESVLPITSGMFRDKVRQLADAGKISDESRILFVNDGSKDKTWEIITALSAKDPCFQGIAQSRNREDGLRRLLGQYFLAADAVAAHYAVLRLQHTALAVGQPQRGRRLPVTGGDGGLFGGFSAALQHI